MVYSPQNHFDAKDCDIRLAVYNGRLSELASKPPFIDVEEPTSLVGKTFTISVGDDEPLMYTFKIDGEVVLSEKSDEEDAYTFNAYYIQDGENVHIMGENIDLKGIYDGETLKLTE
jgi:hypothetical protein